MYYKCHKINFSRGGLYIDFSDWIKKSKNKSKNTDDKCFQYTATVALNYEKIELPSERFSNIKPFINKYNWEGKLYPWKIDDWKTSEKNNPTTALNILHTKEKEISPAYILKIKWNCEKQIILLMPPNKEKEGLWHYLAVKKCLRY